MYRTTDQLLKLYSTENKLTNFNQKKHDRITAVLQKRGFPQLPRESFRVVSSKTKSHKKYKL